MNTFRSTLNNEYKKIMSIHCRVIFSVHAHFKLVDGGRLGRVTCSPSETDENFIDVPTD